jgi:invasion protein IalB
MRAHGRGHGWVWNVGFAILFMVIGGVATLFGGKLLSGAPNQVSIQRFQDWRVMCVPPNEKGEGGGCSLQATIARDDGGTLVSLGVTDTAPGSQMQVVVPHGVMLDPGLGFSVGDGAPKVLPYETCTPQGCMVLVGLDSETLKAMKGATAGQVVVMPANGTPVAIPFSLKGFAEGLDALDDAKGSRDSLWGIFG